MTGSRIPSFCPTGRALTRNVTRRAHLGCAASSRSGGESPAPGATLRLPDTSVSRFHAELRYVDDGWMLRDLGSMNGTWVNTLRITTTVRVRPVDRVSFGAVAFTLTWTDPS